MNGRNLVGFALIKKLKSLGFMKQILKIMVRVFGFSNIFICLSVGIILFSLWPNEGYTAGEPSENIINVDKQSPRPLEEKNTQIRSFTYLEYKKISPVKYRFILHGVSQSFILVLAETFNSSWRIYPVKFSSTNHDVVSGRSEGIPIENNMLQDGSFYETFFMNSLNEVNHIKIDDFSNGWKIDPQLIVKEFPYSTRQSNSKFDIEVVAEYMPQRIYLFGLLICFSTLIIIALLFLIRLRKKNYERNNKNK
jgi:hypothetical protein